MPARWNEPEPTGEQHEPLDQDDAWGAIVAEIRLPDPVNALQQAWPPSALGRRSAPTSPVSVSGWATPGNRVRIGRYDTATGEWKFFYYPLDLPTSPAGGWVGLSELVALGGETFAVIERDNQAGTNARIKRIYRFSIADSLGRVPPS